MFTIDRIMGYQDHVYSKMKRIDDYFLQGSDYITFESSNPYLNNESTRKEMGLYNRKMEKVLRMADNLFAEVNAEIRENNTLIKQLSNSPAKLKYLMEARANKRGLLGDKLNILKMMADTQNKMKKASDDELKLLKDLNQSPTQINSTPFGQGSSTPDMFMSSVLTTKEKPLYNFSQELEEYEANHTSEININPPKETIFQKRDLERNTTPNIEKPTAKYDISKDIINNVLSNPDTYNNTNDTEVDRVIVNALGQRVPILKEYKGDFKEGTMASAKKTLENIQIKENPDIKEFFKYNKELKQGYMVFYNTKTKKEVQGGTHLPLRLLYPFKVDLRNNMVSTNLEYDYDILYTTEPMPDEVAKEWSTLEEMYNKRQQALQERRNNAGEVSIDEIVDDTDEEDDIDN